MRSPAFGVGASNDCPQKGTQGRMTARSPMRCWTFFVASLALAPSNPAAQSQALASFTAPVHLVFGEPVVIEVKVDNTLPEPIHVDLGRDRKENFAIVVKRPDGSVVSPRLTFDGLLRVGRISIGPNAQYSQHLLLNDWVAFDQIGSYLVEVRLRTPIRTASGDVIRPPAAEVFTLHVGARDESVLRLTCQKLTDTVIDFRTVEEQHFAARALGAVTDPVAVPFIRRILDRTELVDWILIDALRRWAMPEARTLLEEMARGAGSDRSMLARSALARPGE